MKKRLNTILTLLGGIGVVAGILLAASCSGNKQNSAPETEEYHAENDIAMTIRSVSDAFEVNEPLNGADYNFEGVLTDGAGMPLYTDIMGSPGQWQIVVTDKEELRIRNMYLGDLLPGNLEQYIVDSLELGDPELTETITNSEGEEMQVSVYALPGGEIRIETSEAKAANGAEGPLMTIILKNLKS